MALLERTTILPTICEETTSIADNHCLPSTDRSLRVKVELGSDLEYPFDSWSLSL